MIVQEPETASHRGMPESAVSTGLVDYILPSREMPERLLDYVNRSILSPVTGMAGPAAVPGEALNKIFLLLRSETGHDFTYYKHNTLIRRLNRRMTINQIDDVNTYVNFLRQHSSEIYKLFKEFLISVTHFFRDPEAFDALSRQALPTLFQRRQRDQPVRVWVPGCATGEEAYTLAILLHDIRSQMKSAAGIQIFATDMDAEAIETARRGVYPVSIARDVPARYLERYCVKEDHVYEIRKEIRELVVFAEQNVTKDPPFSRLDLISCRNLLIYLGPELQRTVLSLFHYALKPGGILFLGPSETVGELYNVFTTLDRKWRIFGRNDEPSLQIPDTNLLTTPLLERKRPRPSKREGSMGAREVIEKMLLELHPAAGTLVNEAYKVVYTYGPIDRYLKLTPGELRNNILDMARPGLEVDLMTAVHFALSQQESISRKGIRVKTNGGQQTVDLTVKPVLAPPSHHGLMLVVFTEASRQQPEEGPTVMTEADETDSRVHSLQQELLATKRYLQTTIEEMQTAYEELQSANEELQSTNEQLKTSKEELQSVNEELVTVNVDYLSKNEQLVTANNDLFNLLRATKVATLFLDSRLSIRSFTPVATEIINLIETDVGRPLWHLSSNMRYDNLVRDAEEVLETLAPLEREVEIEGGEWFNLRLLPYRTVENVIDGVVITFSRITEQKMTEAELRRLNQALDEARQYAENIINTVHEPLLILDAELCVQTANRAFYQMFQVKPEETEGQFMYDLGDGQWNNPSLRRLLEEIIPQDTSFDGYEIEHTFPHTGRRKMRLNARRVIDRGTQPLILLAIDEMD